MKIEQAYSLDSEETVDPELAYDYFWAGIIKDKKNFECPAGNCSAQITCANLDKIRQDMKVDPYYRCVGDHELGCDLVNENLKADVHPDLVSETRKSRTKKQEGLPDIFGLSRPKSHFEKKKVTPENIKVTASKKKRRKQKSEPDSLKRQASTHYSMRAFVSKYLRYQSLDILEQRFISIKGYDVSYREMFVGVNGQDLSTLSQYPRIYFGKAFINKRKKFDYSVNFEESLLYDGKLLRPSTYVSDALIKGAFTKKLPQKKFEDISDRAHPVSLAFVYGVPKVKTSNEKVYININISNLDYFDLREA